MLVSKDFLMFEGVGYDSNIYLICGEVLVDSGTGMHFQDVRDKIINCGIDPKKIRVIVATHNHFDHTGGLKKFRDWISAEGGNATIAVHELDKSYLERGETLSELFGESGKSIKVNSTFSDNSIIDIASCGLHLHVLHTPGHTPGSICLYEPQQKILVSGDTLFENGYGRTDLIGGDDGQMKSSLAKLLNYDIELLLPGHGKIKSGGIHFLIKKNIQELLRRRHHN
jgi:glyoxylase-like metal-dependent hydrolase (beta-lactamase superfamily II)